MTKNLLISILIVLAVIGIIGVFSYSSKNLGGRTSSDVWSNQTYSVTATTTLTADQSGGTFYVDPANGVWSTITLPALADGLEFLFVVSGNFTVDVAVKSAEGDNISGMLVSGAIVACAAEDQINFIANGELLGDHIRLASDGSAWFILDSGATTADKMTCTDN